MCEIEQRTLTVGGSMAVQLVFCFTGLYSVVPNCQHIFLFGQILSSCTVILPPMTSVLWIEIKC